MLTEGVRGARIPAPGLRRSPRSFTALVGEGQNPAAGMAGAGVERMPGRARSPRHTEPAGPRPSAGPMTTGGRGGPVVSLGPPPGWVERPHPQGAARHPGPAPASLAHSPASRWPWVGPRGLLALFVKPAHSVHGFLLTQDGPGACITTPSCPEQGPKRVNTGRAPEPDLPLPVSEPRPRGCDC